MQNRSGGSFFGKKLYAAEGRKMHFFEKYDMIMRNVNEETRCRNGGYVR